MVPAGEPTEQTVRQLGSLIGSGRPDRRRGQHQLARRRQAGRRELEELGIRLRRRRHAGGVWGLEVGYCMMVGGPEAGREQLKPILEVLAPPDGWRHFGDPGAGHFVKMIHNGVEYGIMQAYAEGFELMHKAKFDIDLAEVAGLWNRGSVGALLAVCSSPEKAVPRRRQRSRRHRGARRRLRRGPLDDHRRDRPRRPDAGDHRVAVRALLLARRGRLHAPRAGGRCATSSAVTRSSDRRTADGRIIELQRRSQPAQSRASSGLAGAGSTDARRSSARRAIWSKRKLLPGALQTSRTTGAARVGFNRFGVSRA
jgi:6-phosphogluconate dehydrogenase